MSSSSAQISVSAGSSSRAPNRDKKRPRTSMQTVAEQMAQLSGQIASLQEQMGRLERRVEQLPQAFAATNQGREKTLIAAIAERFMAFMQGVMTDIQEQSGEGPQAPAPAAAPGPDEGARDDANTDAASADRGGDGEEGPSGKRIKITTDQASQVDANSSLCSDS